MTPKRIEELRDGFSHHGKICKCYIHELLTALDDIDAKLEKAKEALEFYGSGNHVPHEHSYGDGTSTLEGGEDGQRARKAIKEIWNE